MRYSQELVELSLKASLRMVGVEYPKVHDVGKVLKAERRRFPPSFSDRIERLADVSKELAENRAAAMYGVEAQGKGAGEIFGKEEGEASLAEAREVLERAQALRGELAGASGD